ncbi:MAG: cysteine--tRNA ligase [Actinobacteria bacterium]|nr:cysteine--tRNA ligase [Actinomycetota bacterium]
MQLYNTLTRSVTEFVPIEKDKVSIYVCGATVQGNPHIGHMRAAVVFDLLRRWFIHSGYQVRFVRNVTDIDDKILHTAGHEDRPWFEVAAHYEREFTAAYNALGILPPSAEPRATGHISQMVELIQDLIDRDMAYAVNGDVYFAVDKYPAYGELSNQKLDQLMVSEDKGERDKRYQHDFALWKKVDEQPTWPTPWGAGRPGWHLECSAMARFYLGKKFDIHGGGLDLAFPHHENEIAQSKAAGDDFAQRWLHSAWVTQSGEKMSKSLGNSLQVAEVLKLVSGMELRYYLLSAHYRSMLEYSPAALTEAATGFNRIINFLDRAKALVSSPTKSLPAEFMAAMNDDLNLPIALSVLHDCVRNGNSAIAAKNQVEIEAALAQVSAMLEVLGLAISSESNSAATDQIIDSLVQTLLAEREAARARKDFATADLLRDRLLSAGLNIEDTADGVRWSVKR